MKLGKEIQPEVFQVDRSLHHAIYLEQYAKSFDFRNASSKYKKDQLSRLDNVFEEVEIGDEAFPSIKRSIDTFDLIKPLLSIKIVNACYEILSNKFSKARAINCLKAINRYCLFIKENPYIHLQGHRSLYIPEAYGFIESPINSYTLPKKKASDASKHYLTKSEYKIFLTMLWKQFNEAYESKEIEAFHQLFFICVIAGELGLRLQEILGLELKHIYLMDGICLVTKGKGSNCSGYRKRETPLTDFFRASLSDFLKAFPRRPEEPLIQNKDGDFLSHSTAYKWLRKAINQIEEQCLPILIEPGFGFHAFRRSYARFYLEDGGDFMQLMKNTGWKFASTASHYIGASKLPINYLGD